MSEISKPINPTAEIKEQKITLSETQKETLTDSLGERVRNPRESQNNYRKTNIKRVDWK